MSTFSEFNIDGVSIPEDIEQAKTNRLVIGRHHTHFIESQSGMKMSSPEWTFKPFAGMLDLIQLRADFGTEYDYVPDKMSFELYGTHELWPLLLHINGVTDRSMFRGPTLQYIDPVYKSTIEGMMHFSLIRAERSDKLGIPDLGNLTVREVLV